MVKTLIEEETDAARDYALELIPNTDPELVRLCRKNVAKVEACIKNDSAYFRAMDETAGPDGKGYEGSSAYWMVQLKDILIDGHSVSRGKYDLAQVLENAVKAIDRDNNTHLNADGSGRRELFERLMENKDRLVDLLKHPGPDYELIEILSDWTHPERYASSDGKKHVARRNLSFASKFCQEACFWMFAGTEFQDNYSKYDDVVINVLPLYLYYYKIPDFGYLVDDLKGKDVEDYKKYQAAIDAVRGKLLNPISRNGFDHLIWYYYKGRLSALKSKPASFCYCIFESIKPGRLDNISCVVEMGNARYYHGNDSHQYYSADDVAGYVREHEARVALSMYLSHSAWENGFCESIVRKIPIQVLRHGTITFCGLSYSIRLISVADLYKSRMRNCMVCSCILDGGKRIELRRDTIIIPQRDEGW